MNDKPECQRCGSELAGDGKWMGDEGMVCAKCLEKEKARTSDTETE